METVQFTIDNNLCISCGICKAVCPKRCINMVKKNGLYTPAIDSSCVNCGVCYGVCHGKGKSRIKSEDLRCEELIGEYKAIYNAWSLTKNIRHFSASGGVVTTLTHNLLMAEE